MEVSHRERLKILRGIPIYYINNSIGVYLGRFH